MGQAGGLNRFHPEILPAAQREALAAVGQLATRYRFHLAGGTAVALQLGHRQSVDLDWFTPVELAEPLGLAERLRSELPGLETTSIAPGTLHARLFGVRCSFLSYRYALLRPTLAWPDFACELASLEDLACMKLAAVAQRGARKDFLDVFAIGRERLSLGVMLNLYREKYGIRDVGHVLASLCYFDDAEREPFPVTQAPIEWGEVKAALRAWVKGQAT